MSTTLDKPELAPDTDAEVEEAVEVPQEACRQKRPQPMLVYPKATAVGRKTRPKHPVDDDLMMHARETDVVVAALDVGVMSYNLFRRASVVVSLTSALVETAIDLCAQK